MTTTRVAQSLKTLGGAAFERIAATILNGFLQNDNILVTRAKEDKLKKFIDSNQMSIAYDHDQDPVFMARNAWHLQDALDKNPDISFNTTK